MPKATWGDSDFAHPGCPPFIILARPFRISQAGRPVMPAGECLACQSNITCHFGRCPPTIRPGLKADNGVRVALNNKLAPCSVTASWWTTLSRPVGSVTSILPHPRGHLELFPFQLRLIWVHVIQWPRRFDWHSTTGSDLPKQHQV
jgi:hypothetical protein